MYSRTCSELTRAASILEPKTEQMNRENEMDECAISVVIPAHNEEKYIAKCLQSVIRAAEQVKPDAVELIVVANRCTDKTAEIAAEFGARILTNDEKCISAIRNTGIRAAHGEIIVTLDADSVMSEESLLEIRQMLGSGKYIGGGTRIKFERMSVGIFFSAVYVAINLLPVILKNKAALSGGMFWFHRRDFDAIGGFDESLVSLEDMDFAVRLNRLANERGMKYGTLKRSYIVTSSRKFDDFGDWYLIRNSKLTKRIFTGRDRQASDQFYYDVR